jgi:hypothetical protein
MNNDTFGFISFLQDTSNVRTAGVITYRGPLSYTDQSDQPLPKNTLQVPVGGTAQFKVMAKEYDDGKEVGPADITSQYGYTVQLKGSPVTNVKADNGIVNVDAAAQPGYYAVQGTSSSAEMRAAGTVTFWLLVGSGDTGDKPVANYFTKELNFLRVHQKTLSQFLMNYNNADPQNWGKAQDGWLVRGYGATANVAKGMLQPLSLFIDVLTQVENLSFAEANRTVVTGGMFQNMKDYFSSDPVATNRAYVKKNYKLVRTALSEITKLTGEIQKYWIDTVRNKLLANPRTKDMVGKVDTAFQQLAQAMAGASSLSNFDGGGGDGGGGGGGRSGSPIKIPLAQTINDPTKGVMVPLSLLTGAGLNIQVG